MCAVFPQALWTNSTICEVHEVVSLGDKYTLDSFAFITEIP